MSGQSQASTSITELAEYLSEPVAFVDRQRARLHLLDWLGCAIAGRKYPVGSVFFRTYSDTPMDQIFIWGALGNILEMDDVDKRALLHPGPSIVPAALGIAGTQPDVSFDRVLEAIVIGYEATIRLGRAVGQAHYTLWHSTGTCGSIGAAAAASTLFNLNNYEISHSLALAVSQATGMWQTRHEPASMGKQLHTAHAARAGAQAADLARLGAKGPLTILEGPQGFFAATCPDGNPTDLLAAYGKDWLIHQVSFKPWPACRHAHAAIDAALLAREDEIHPEAIETIIVRTYPDALIFCDKIDPQSVIEAKFSLQHSVVIALGLGKPELAHFEMETVQRPDVKALRDRVIVEVHPDYQARYPAHFGVGIDVLLKDGSCVSKTVADALGDPENPLSEADISAKAAQLMQVGGLSEDISNTLITAILDQDDKTHFAKIFNLINGVLQ